jgi:hypothetical protein
MSWWTPEHLPDGRRQAGDRHLNFHKVRDNLERAEITLASDRSEVWNSVTELPAPFATNKFWPIAVMASGPLNRQVGFDITFKSAAR